MKHMTSFSPPREKDFKHLADVGYANIERLSTGGQANIYLAQHSEAKDGKKYAVKIFKNANFTIIPQIVIPLVYHHPYITPYERSVTPLIYEMPVAEFDFHGYMLQDSDIEQILAGLYFLHNQGVYHGDIKPENILSFAIDDNNSMTKIADFGLSRFFSRYRFTQDYDEKAPQRIYMPATLLYADPAYLKQRNYDFRMDCWSLAASIFTTLSGKTIFEALLGIPAINTFEWFYTYVPKISQTMIDNLLNRYQKEAGFTDTIMTVLRGFLVLDISQRKGIKDILDTLKIKPVKGAVKTYDFKSLQKIKYDSDMINNYLYYVIQNLLMFYDPGNNNRQWLFDLVALVYRLYPYIGGNTKLLDACFVLVGHYYNMPYLEKEPELPSLVNDIVDVLYLAQGVVQDSYYFPLCQTQGDMEYLIDYVFFNPEAYLDIETAKNQLKHEDTGSYDDLIKSFLPPVQNNKEEKKT